MWRPEPRGVAAVATGAVPAPLRPTPALQVAGAARAGAYGAVRTEVEDFIARGSLSQAGSAAAPVLSAEGQFVRAALQAGTAVLAPAPEPSKTPAEVGGGEPVASVQSAFLAQIAPAAREAAQRLGVAPELVAAHAALESGWGRQPLRQPDGRSTHNLFGLKAGRGWQGEVVRALTTEVEDGERVKRHEPFRSYPDQASAFQDYASLLLDNPRYRGALQAGADARAFARGLAAGGYATDPDYADKLERVARSVRGTR